MDEFLRVILLNLRKNTTAEFTYNLCNSVIEDVKFHKQLGYIHIVYTELDQCGSKKEGHPRACCSTTPRQSAWLFVRRCR